MSFVTVEIDDIAIVPCSTDSDERFAVNAAGNVIVNSGSSNIADDAGAVGTGAGATTGDLASGCRRVRPGPPQPTSKSNHHTLKAPPRRS